MSNIDLMLQAIEFIETYLTEDISVADMADSVSFTIFHFSRTFNRTVRHSPYDYLMRRRLCEAARCLLESDEKIIDIAFKYQFKAPETFSRAFKRIFNLQPRQVKSRGWFDHRRFMGKPTPEYLEFINIANSLKPEAKNIPPKKIVGIAAPINTLDSNNETNKIWNLLRREIQSVFFKADNRDYYGIRMFLKSTKTNQYMYLAGTSLMEGEIPPDIFIQKNIPGIDYACFELLDQANAAPFTRNYVYQSWWSKATNSLLPSFEIEYYNNQFDLQLMTKGVLRPTSLCFPIGFE